MKSVDLLHFLLGLQKECGGVIPFARYMQEALYHPEFGYYSSQIKDVGAAGDFSTSATLDPDLGKAIAAWITKRAEELGWKRIPVLEIGAGSGALAKSVLRNLGWKTRLRVSYKIYETSPILRKNQKKALRWHGVGWVNSLSEYLEQTRGKALVFSNELVDAFPCRLFQKSDEGWHELGVSISPEGALSETILNHLPTNPWFTQFGTLPKGQRVELLDSYRDWMQGWSGFWKEGALLTIDYGETAPHLYDRRTEGSLRAYWRHRRLTGRDLYARFGKQDLTSDVNFSDIMRWGNELGWNNSPLMTQGEFLQAWVKPSPSSMPLAPEAREAFKVLEQSPSKTQTP